jgi:DNA polymerase
MGSFSLEQFDHHLPFLITQDRLTRNRWAHIASRHLASNTVHLSNNFEKGYPGRATPRIPPRLTDMAIRKPVLSTAATLIPEQATLEQLKAIAAGCRACPLWERGTQTVFGAGRRTASILFVGEQPGNDEDLAGEPFVGPAGRLLDKALTAAGIDRGQCYVTNVVKHFKWEARGKRRIHVKPNSAEITACMPWLQEEVRLVRPRLIVCLGATAAQALLGRTFRVTQHRGEILPSELAPGITATVHPSSILRAPDDESRHAQMAEFIADLRKAAEWLLQKPAARERVS